MQTSTLIRSLAIVPIAALALTLAPRGSASADDKPQASQAAGDKPATPFPGEDLDAKRKDVRRLLELNGAKAAAAAQIDPMVKSFESLPGMTPDMMESMKEEFKASLNEVMEMSIEPYMQHLSHDDIKAMIAFAESPVGQRVAAAQPKIVAETTAAGMKWGQSLQPRIMKRLADLRREKAEGSN